MQKSNRRDDQVLPAFIVVTMERYGKQVGFALHYYVKSLKDFASARESEYPG